MIKSAATLRAEQYKNHGKEWFGGFIYTPLKGLEYEEGVHRRDPSSVIKVDGVYYVYYTKSLGPHFGNGATEQRDPLIKKFPWDYADIWYASSVDGMTWEEQGCAVHRGGPGEYDERTLCTPDVLAHEGKYYLVYQAIPQGTYTGEDENVAMAIAESPTGPFVKMKDNILVRMKDGKWFGEEGTYNDGNYIGLTHDPMLMYYKDKFYLYYKCGATKLGDLKCHGQDTRWGVAISDNVLGPYEHSEYNPVTNSGHETMLWHYNGGIAALLNRDGPEKDTIQYSKDGVNFEMMASIYDTPQAGGAYRCENPNSSPLEGIRWGICHYDERGSLYNCLMRFDLDSRHPYAFPHVYPDSNCQGLGWFW